MVLMHYQHLTEIINKEDHMNFLHQTRRLNTDTCCPLSNDGSSRAINYQILAICRRSRSLNNSSILKAWPHYFGDLAFRPIGRFIWLREKLQAAKVA